MHARRHTHTHTHTQSRQVLSLASGRSVTDLLFHCMNLYGSEQCVTPSLLPTLTHPVHKQQKHTIILYPFPINLGGCSYQSELEWRWMDGWGIDGRRMEGEERIAKALSPRTERGGPQSSPAHSPGTLLYTPGVRGEERAARDAHTCIYTYTQCTHPFIHNHSFTDTHTKSSRSQMGPGRWHWFVFLIPPSSPYFFISHATSLVRLPTDTSQSYSPGLGSGGGRGWKEGGENSGGIFGEMEKSKRGGGGKEEEEQ